MFRNGCGQPLAVRSFKVTALQRPAVALCFKSRWQIHPLDSLDPPEITDNDGKPYLCTDEVHSDGSACCGRGEIWMRGNSIGSGYYKLPEQTAADFDEDGWFHSGDIGLITPEGKVKIIDRKKNLVKLKGGEYVALELINVTYNNHELINADAGGVCALLQAMKSIGPSCLLSARRRSS